jgi:hypothetical protein
LVRSPLCYIGCCSSALRDGHTRPVGDLGGILHATVDLAVCNRRLSFLGGREARPIRVRGACGQADFGGCDFDRRRISPRWQQWDTDQRRCRCNDQHPTPASQSRVLNRACRRMLFARPCRRQRDNSHCACETAPPLPSGGGDIGAARSRPDREIRRRCIPRTVQETHILAWMSRGCWRRAA